jgi:transcription initiation factor TFIIIB Brf1 subunit/transcription initiation factor TFIIB
LANRITCPRCAGSSFTEVSSSPILICIDCGKAINERDLVTGQTMEDPTEGVKLDGKD